MRTRPDLHKEFIRLHRARNSSKNYYICELRVFGAMKRIIITLLAFVLSSFTLSRTGGISLAVIFVKHSYENTFRLPRQHMPQPYGGVCP